MKKNLSLSSTASLKNLSALLLSCCLYAPASWADYATKNVTDSDSAQSAQKPELNMQQLSDPLLKGLTPADLEMARASASKYYGKRWLTIQQRSRFVRFRMLESLNHQHVPSSLQIIPVVESTYNPYALSHAGALGLWQLMPRTAKGLGIEADKKFNGRRNIEQSTEAAVQYLMKLHDRFDNWPLALAAYNLGPNAVSRRLKKSPWDIAYGLEKMPVPTSTRAYVQHIIGLAALLEAGSLHFPEPIKTVPVHLQPPVDIHLLAKLGGMEKDDIFRFNPSLNQAQYFTCAVTIHVPEFNYLKIQNNISGSGPKFVQLKVRKGDSLWSIAKDHGTTLKLIKQINRDAGKILRIGQRLKIPANQLAKASPNENPLLPSNRRIRYKVRSGDSLWAIASRFGTTVKAISRVNSLARNSMIRPGDTLWVLAQVRPS